MNFLLLRRLPLLAVLLTLIALNPLNLSSAAAAPSVIFVGADNGNSTGAAWRDAHVTKPQFGDAIGSSNIYGNDGYYLFNTGFNQTWTTTNPNAGVTLVVTPPYIASVDLATTASYSGFGYGTLDTPSSSDPVIKPTSFSTTELGYSGFYYNTPGTYNTVASFTVNGAVPTTFRVGYVWGMAAIDVFSGVRIINAANSSIVATATIVPAVNQADFYFFDIKGATDGDKFYIQTLWANYPRNGISGLTFDGGPVTLKVPSQYPTIQAGIDAARPGDTVLVADGTYSGNGNRDLDFKGKSLTVTSQNGPAMTVIDCGGYSSTDGSGNHRGFYIHSGEKNATISGFTVKNGYETLITSISDSGNGGGVYNSNGSGSGTITLTNCTITGNTAKSGNGGGVLNFNYNGSGTITLTNCTITGYNGSYGGGVFNSNGNDSGTITLTNCTITGNTATYDGGGVYNFNAASLGTITLINDVIYGDIGGEIFTRSGTTPNLLSHCDIQGGYSGTGNINADPLFVNAAAGDLHLKPGSPCLGAGTASGAPPTDLDGSPRPNPPSMGAYELAPAPAAITAFTLSPSQVAAIGPNITVVAAVTASGTFGKVTASPAPGMLGSASPTFTLTNSGAAWTGVIPTAYLKLARANPITFIATGTRADGTTATATATLIVGALPALSLAVSSNKSTVPAGRTFSVKGFVRNLTAVIATPVTVTIPLPTYLSFVSSPDFTFNSAQNTLTWTGPLAANSGSHAISVEFKASANTPTDKQIAISVTASAPDFQSITQSASIVVGAPPAPVGVDIDSTRAAGQADGMAIITSAVGATPLQAIISPVSGLGHAWLGVDYAYDAGGGQLAPTTDVSVGTLAAIMGVAGPGASPTYAASFPRIGSQCNIGLRFNDVSAGLNIGSIVVSALSGILGAKKGDPTEVFEFYNEFRKIRAFKDAADQLMHPATTPVGKAKQAAHIVKDFLNLNFNELDTLAIYLSGKTGKVITAVGVKNALKAVGRVESIVEIGQIIVDEISFTISTGGADAEITFTGSAVRHPDQLR